jgi:phage gp46-like protein
MSDIYLQWNPTTQTCDWSPNGTELETSVLLSLFTDAAAAPDFVPADNDQRGWWATAYSGQEIGSRLWQLDRAVKSDASLKLGIGEAQRCLQWMIDAGVASAISVDGAWQGSMLALSVQITAPSGETNTYRYGPLWTIEMAGISAPQAGYAGPAAVWDSANWDDGSGWTP